jgi:hypothetical protein
LRSKLLLTFLVLLLAVTGLSAYLAVAVGSELYEARTALSGPVGELDRDTLLDARAHLAAAEDELDGVAGSLLSVVPVAGHTVRAVDDVAEAMIRVVDAADVLTRKLEAIEGLQVIEGGKIRTDLLEQLRGPLLRQRDALAELEAAASDGRSGWIPPPLWDVLDELEGRAAAYASSAARGSDAVALMGPMLGARGPRTYLVVLLNNAELRGAGGIPSAAGTITAVEGRLTLGRFRHTVALRGPKPHAQVAAPADFRRRFGFYGADTTFWTNTTFSPDVPDVALVAARAFEKVTGTAVDGVVLVDPRGIAALLPEDAAIRVRGSGATVDRAALPAYTYSTVYADLGGAERARRRALLRLGQKAFEAILGGGSLTGRTTLEDAGRALAAGHVRIVSFDPVEQRVLDRLDASGDLDGAPADSLLVAAQNFSADKLDYWARRDVRHSCTISDDGDEAACTTEVRIRNDAPRGLIRYVAGKPYGVVEHLFEVYVPEDAEVRSVGLDGAPVEFYPDRQDGHEVVGAFVETARGERHTLRVGYELPLDGSYTLEVLPQPLAHDARLRVTITAPASWLVAGEGRRELGTLRYSGSLDRTLRFSAAPVDKEGLAAAWDALVGFWREPLF